MSEALTPGTLVVCWYRMPSVDQPWIHPIHVGMVEEPGNDPAAWNGINSEAEYCEGCGRVKVRYPDDIVQHELRGELSPITPEEAALSFRDKIALFLGEEALANYDRARRRKEQS